MHVSVLSCFVFKSLSSATTTYKWRNWDLKPDPCNSKVQGGFSLPLPVCQHEPYWDVFGFLLKKAVRKKSLYHVNKSSRGREFSSRDPGDSLHCSTQPDSLSLTLIILIFKRWLRHPRHEDRCFPRSLTTDVCLQPELQDLPIPKPATRQDNRSTEAQWLAHTS